MFVGRCRLVSGLVWVGLLVAPAAHADDPYWNSKPVSYWVGLLQSGQPAERLHAARGLNELAAARGAETIAPALPYLIAALDADLPELRGAAATGVGQFGASGGDAVAGLRKLVGSDPDPQLKAAS